MREAEKCPGKAAKVKYIADVLRELRRLSCQHEFLSYLIEMAEVEAQNHAKENDMAAAITASSAAVLPRRELTER
jgi:hypothetical protein